jgi:hypothetical protein
MKKMVPEKDLLNLSFWITFFFISILSSKCYMISTRFAQPDPKANAQFNATRDQGQKTQLVVGWWAHGRFTDNLFFTNGFFFNDCLIVCLCVGIVLRSIYLSKDI